LCVEDVEPGERLGLLADLDFQSGMFERRSGCGHGLGESVGVPLVGEEIDVFAEAVHEAVCLERKTPGEREAIRRERPEAFSGQ
jgi:hypothetical protein